MENARRRTPAPAGRIGAPMGLVPTACGMETRSRSSVPYCPDLRSALVLLYFRCVSEHAQKSTRITSQQRWRNRCVFPRYLHQQVQDRKPPVMEHKRVLFTVIALPQAALPLGSSACNHTSESLDTLSAGLIASGANNGRSHSGRVSRLVPFVVALRQHGRATGC